LPTEHCQKEIPTGGNHHTNDQVMRGFGKRSSALRADWRLQPGKLIKTSFTPETLLVFEPNLLAPGTSSWEEEPSKEAPTILRLCFSNGLDRGLLNRQVEVLLGATAFR